MLFTKESLEASANRTIDQINNLDVKNLEIFKLKNKKYLYDIECYVNNRFMCFRFNSNLKKTTASSLSRYSDRRFFPNLGDNFMYIINQRINKEVNNII